MLMLSFVVLVVVTWILVVRKRAVFVTVLSFVLVEAGTLASGACRPPHEAIEGGGARTLGGFPTATQVLLDGGFPNSDGGERNSVDLGVELDAAIIVDASAPRQPRLLDTLCKNSTHSVIRFTSPSTFPGFECGASDLSWPPRSQWPFNRSEKLCPNKGDRVYKVSWKVSPGLHRSDIDVGTGIYAPEDGKFSAPTHGLGDPLPHGGRWGWYDYCPSIAYKCDSSGQEAQETICLERCRLVARRRLGPVLHATAWENWNPILWKPAELKGTGEYFAYFCVPENVVRNGSSSTGTVERVIRIQVRNSSRGSDHMDAGQLAAGSEEVPARNLVIEDCCIHLSSEIPP